MKKLLIGTTNQTKFDEYKKLLSSLPLEIVELSEAGLEEQPDEAGKTLEQNAVAKAKWYFEKSGIPTLVEESGLEIAALSGEKWLGRELAHKEFVNRLLAQMKGKDNRSCRLNCVVALATPFGIMTSDSAVEGVIAEKATSKKIAGHPYRSVMFFPNYNKYYCDLTEKEHEILNHRQHALDKIKDMFVEIAK